MKIQMSYCPFWGVDNKYVDMLESVGVVFKEKPYRIDATFILSSNKLREAVSNGWIEDDLNVICNFIKASDGHACLGLANGEVCILVGSREYGWVGV